MSGISTFIYEQGFSDTLRRLIRQSKMSYAELTVQAGFSSKGYLHNLVTGRRRPDQDQIQRICEALGVERNETNRLLRLARKERYG